MSKSLPVRALRSTIRLSPATNSVPFVTFTGVVAPTTLPEPVLSTATFTRVESSVVIPVILAVIALPDASFTWLPAPST